MVKKMIAAVLIAAAVTEASVPASILPYTVQAEAKSSSKRISFEGISLKIPKKYRFDKKATEDATLGMPDLKSKVYSNKTSPDQVLEFDIMDAVASDEGMRSMGYTVKHFKLAGYKAVKSTIDEEADDGSSIHRVKITFKRNRKYYCITAENIKEINTIIRSAKKIGSTKKKVR